MAEIRAGLDELKIGLAYDDFGAGQSRLNELVAESARLPEVRHVADPRHRRRLAAAAADGGDAWCRWSATWASSRLPKGSRRQAEAETCLQMGFDLGQGFLFGKPAAAVPGRAMP